MDTLMPPHPIDRSGWDAGPWDAEPDRLEFQHAGFPCLCLRTALGAWFGYVAVPPGHPDHGRPYADVPVSVHGGLTSAHARRGAVCHVPAPGDPDNVWWLGFDCAHVYDLVPGFRIDADPWHLDHDRYRDLAYVRRETERLADHLRARA